ncbi:MAG: sigma 54-interacting transcriptional regulator [Polyangiaceae bacterium]|nr:sigma 54-interacting transcriptional regulator [Polyangiaceae bacterium]
MHVPDVDDAAGPPSSTNSPRREAGPLQQISKQLTVIAGELRRASEGASADELRREAQAAIVELRRASAALEATLAGTAPNAGATAGGDVPPASQRRTSPKPSARFTFDDMIGDDPGFRACLELARRAALSDLPILVSGESGTGKEMLAQSIHNVSERARSPFVGINVAAIPRELLESELFGYAQGAFSGARAGGKPGLFELAEDGTLLLDEVGDMPFDLQVKLLRVLQEKKVIRVGGSREIPFNARVITATHRDLKRATELGTFRPDLYYRLRGIHLRIPPLRERRGDIDLLIDACLSRFAARLGRPKPELLPRVRAAYRAANWPGNVRELVHLTEAEASLLRPGETHIVRMPTSLQNAFAPPSSVRPPTVGSWLPPPLPEAPTAETEGFGVGGGVGMDASAEKRLIEEKLALYAGNMSKVARSLGVARGTLYNRMRRLGLRPTEPAELAEPVEPSERTPRPLKR